MRRSLYLLVAGLLPLLAQAKGIGDFFVSDPGYLFEMLDKSQRMDILDYYNSGKKVDAQNLLGGISRIEEMTPEYIKLQMTESSTVELRMFVTGKQDTLLVAIRTLAAPAFDSQITMYDEGWNPVVLDKYFKSPSTKDFLQDADNREVADILSRIEFPLVAASFTPEGCVEMRLTVGDYMDAEQFAELKPRLKEKLSYYWDGKRFSKER